jgi:hypothetical protein
MLNEIAASDGALVGVRAFTEQHQRIVGVNVCVCVYVNVYVYVCMYVCMYIHTYIYIYLALSE